MSVGQSPGLRDDQVRQELEITVLTQLRDGMTAQTMAIGKLNDKIDEMQETVIGLEKSNFSERISSLKTEMKEELVKMTRQIDSLEGRVRVAENLLAKYGMALTVAGTIGGASIGVLATKIFGG